MKINRRAMLASLVAASGASLSAQEPAKIDPTLYIPKAHRVEDLKLLHEFMDEYAFVDLVTSSPTLRITHIPVILERTAGTYGRLWDMSRGRIRRVRRSTGARRVSSCSVARTGTSHPRGIRKRKPCRRGTLRWFTPAGRPSAITDKTALHKLLGRLIEKFESQEASGYDFSKLPESYVSPMLGGIVGFEMQIESLEGKFKLGQERSDADKQGLLEHLGQARRRERSLQDLTASFYKRSQTE